MLTHGHIWSLLTLGRVHNLVRTRGVAGLVPLDVNRVDSRLVEVEALCATCVDNQDIGAQPSVRALYLKHAI